MKTFLFLVIILAGPALARDLPVEIIPGAHATVSAQTRTWGGRLYVSGASKHRVSGHPPSLFSVEVELLDPAGRRLALADDDLRVHSHHRTPHGRAGRYTVSFPSRLVHEAGLIRIVVHDHAHRGCKRCPSAT